MPVKAYYQNHLARFYSWMFGDFDEAVEKQRRFFSEHHIAPAASKIALDLGAGPGFQSLALEKLGFKVHAVDFSEELLRELSHRSPTVQTHLGDLRDLSFAMPLHPELIVCMGDTITHLDSLRDVQGLVSGAQQLLPAGGNLIVTYRDLSAKLPDLERVIAVRSDENRILTCVLEDAGDRVRVFDLLHEKSAGKWQLHKSCYLKLKIPHEWLDEVMAEAGFRVQMSRLPNGMFALIGRKPADRA